MFKWEEALHRNGWEKYDRSHFGAEACLYEEDPLVMNDPSEPTNAPVIFPDSVSLSGLRVTLLTMLKSLDIPRTRLSTRPPMLRVKSEIALVICI